MFLLNGEQIKVNQLIEKYQVPIPDKNARRKERIFTIAENSKRKDYLNNRIAHPNKILAPAEFTGTDGEGFDVNLRYYTRKRPTKRGGIDVIEYQPLHIGMDGESKIMDARRQMEEYVYMYLHPWNKQSPLRRGGKFKYELIDEIANAESSNMQSKDLLWCLNVIHNGDITVLRQRAEGFRIGAVGKLEDSEVRQRLEEIAFRDPTKFKYSWEDASVLYRGVVNTAIQRGIVVQREMQGTRFWQWNSDHGGERICPIPRETKDASTALLQYAADNFSTTMRAIENAVDGSGVEDKLRTKSQEDEPSREKDLVVSAVEYGVLVSDPSENAVYLMKSGEREDIVFNFEQPAGWMDRLAEHLQTEEGNPLLKKLQGKMRAYKMHQKRKAK